MPRLFSARSKALGGWTIGSYEATIRGDRVSHPIYLLSDGRISLDGHDPRYLREGNSHDEVAQALRSFRQKYGL